MEGGTLLRLTIFVSLFAILAVAEATWPRRAIAERTRRWSVNLGLAVVNTGVLRLLFFVVPALPVLAALYADERGWGLLPLLGIRGVAASVVAFVVLDLAVYAQHVAFHYVPAFWRVHRVHHADVDFDVSTGLRFHPGEILLSQAWKIFVVLVLGAPAGVVFAFEIVLNVASMFTHSNLQLPDAFERSLRLATVTPEMHRVHHSVVTAETNSNFGFNLSLWDRLFGTYRAKAADDQARMAIGLPSYRGPDASRFLWLMALPFASGPSA